MTIRGFGLQLLAATWLAGTSLLAGAQPAESPTVIRAGEIDAVVQQGKPFLLDVRTAEEVSTLGGLPQSLNIPVDELEGRLDELPRDRLILTA